MRTTTLERLKVAMPAWLREQERGHNGSANGHERPILGQHEAAKIAKELAIGSPVHVGSGLFCVVATVTPEHAICWLNDRNEKNRNEIDGNIDAMSRDIVNGNWETTHQGIAFDGAGQLIDGQNRLAAIIKAMKSVEVVVFIYAGARARVVVDTGVSRKFRDQVKIAFDKDVSPLEQGVVKLLTQAPTHGGRLSNDEMYATWQKHQEMFAWLRKQFPSMIRGITKAASLGAIARAYYHIDREKLERFCEVFRTSRANEEEPAESTIIALRCFCMSVLGATGKGATADVYMKTEWAIDRFVSGKSCQKVYAASRELYPIIDEATARKFCAE